MRVGTSTNGSAAFGASISLQTTGARSESYGETSTVGSYGTFSSNVLWVQVYWTMVCLLMPVSQGLLVKVYKKRDC